ncbi:MAG: GNAT family N-acetyltransferase [Thermoguttaceae bacterium]|nr:GNAT family N-acetyltransferase [Thermoguttaceae bacterium]
MTDTGAQYVCTRDEAIVGAFALNADPQGAYREGKWKRSLPEGSYLVLHALAVDPDRQREGIGSEILRFAAGRARSEGYRAVRADIVPGNFPARRLFEMNGFTHAGDADLRQNIGDVPLFSLYELNW